ncbi:hypothetical protein [Sutcliffiella rhizosphaerae]|uniref:Uncharacterized protein n=1 Tax=Sutcliffiella rhizosphaerae TaxID=2880967 RepID=A0ABN8AEV3_9BACI|nr:hypothetical protein [Sutcliffiella rhizosphaerae]CAG9622257.1 hypothetical protein BACCIP111883_03048 [Sutcliffiella rhizosphaerae]
MAHTKKENILILVELENYSFEVIKRGVDLANLMNGSSYITFFASKADEFNINLYLALSELEKAANLYKVEGFCVEYYHHEKGVIEKIKKQIKEFSITQLLLARDIESRFDEIVYGSYSNLLLKKIPNTDLHFVSADTSESFDVNYETGIAGFLKKDIKGRNIVHFSSTEIGSTKGIFFKLGFTDFNNGLFIEFTDKDLVYYDVVDNIATKSSHQIENYLL